MNLFLQAIDALARRVATPSDFNSQQWRSVAPAIRQRSFFSATVANARVLTRLKNMLQNWQTLATETVINPTSGAQETVYKTNGLADFRERATDLMISEGMASPEDFGDERITNLVSNSRLKLIYNTNLEQAQMFADWQAKMSNRSFLNQFPAAEFVRSPGAVDPRPLHVENEGQIRRWDDFGFWLRMNNADIGGFEVPWGPWGFNSYMFQRPVSRERAIKLGLVKRDEIVQPPDVRRFGVSLASQFNAKVTVDTETIDPQLAEQMRQDIRDRLGPDAIGRDGRPTLDAYKRALGL
jgi:hypothetical protein